MNGGNNQLTHGVEVNGNTAVDKVCNLPCASSIQSATSQPASEWNGYPFGRNNITLVVPKVWAWPSTDPLSHDM
jgi:hypothetical protein